MNNNIIFVIMAMLVYWLSLSNASAFYDPGTQRWLNRDPLQERGGINMYEHCFNLENNLIDPFGLNSGVGTFPVRYPSIPIRIPIPPAGPCIGIAVAAGCVAVTLPIFFPTDPVPILYPPTYPGQVNAPPLSICNPRRIAPTWPEPPYPKSCDQKRDECIGSGQDCISCWLECKAAGKWPDYKCNSSGYKPLHP